LLQQFAAMQVLQVTFMKQTQSTLLVFIFFALLTMGFQCGVERITSIYEFSEKFTLTPYKKIYHTGDTIRLQFSTTDKSLYDRLSNRRISTDTTNFSLGFQYVEHFPTQSYDTLAYTITQSGVNQGLIISNGYNNLILNVVCDNATSYNVELAFVPKKTGIYTIQLPSATIESCPLRSSRFPIATLFFSFDLTDTNKDIYLSIPEAQRRDSKAIEAQLDSKKLFAFKVE
jgi:hypothetical protein